MSHEPRWRRILDYLVVLSVALYVLLCLTHAADAYGKGNGWIPWRVVPGGAPAQVSEAGWADVTIDYAAHSKSDLQSGCFLEMVSVQLEI